jgi:shikimate kinase
MKPEKNIVLIGMRGSGKSAIGKTLASHLSFEFVDVDKTLEAGEGVKISEIVKQHDWEHFRDLETKYAALAAEKTQTIISTGGGVILREENIENLRKNGVVVFIHAPIEHLARRVAKNDTRPSLTGKTPHEELEEIWNERKELYKKYADAEVFFDFETKNKKTDLIRKSKLVLKAVNEYL